MAKQREEKTVYYSEVTKADHPALRWVKKFSVFIFVVAFMGACLWQIFDLKAQGKQLDQAVGQLQDQIEDEKEKELQIKVDLEYYQSDEYKEQMARDRCKLIYPGEFLINIQK